MTIFIVITPKTIPDAPCLQRNVTQLVYLMQVIWAVSFIWRIELLTELKHMQGFGNWVLF